MKSTSSPLPQRIRTPLCIQFHLPRHRQFCISCSHNYLDQQKGLVTLTSPFPLEKAFPSLNFSLEEIYFLVHKIPSNRLTEYLSYLFQVKLSGREWLSLSSINASTLLQHLSQSSGSISTGQDPTVQNALRQTLQGTESVMEHVSISKSVSYIIDKDFWNDYGIYGSLKHRTRKTICGRTYRSGDVIQIDFGHLNIGHEQSFMHMAIVIADYKGLLVVVPIQSDRNQNFSPDTARAVLKMPATDYSFLSHDSVLLIHQIKVVSKNRIYKVLGHTVAQTKIMDDLQKDRPAILS